MDCAKIKASLYLIRLHTEQVQLAIEGGDTIGATNWLLMIEQHCADIKQDMWPATFGADPFPAIKAPTV